MLTPYADVNTMLDYFRQALPECLGDNLVGLYLFGSLTYGGFNPDTSDIDLLAIVRQPLSPAMLEQVRQLHARAEQLYPRWQARIEASYTPLHLFTSTLPPAEPRPYYGEATFYPAAEYGNEWLINNALLHTHGVTLLGPDFRSLAGPVAMREIQSACIRDLFREWEPKRLDRAWLDNGHYQSYLILNLCRILYTVTTARLGSKPEAAAWVRATWPQWAALIEAAEGWRYGDTLPHHDTALRFLDFVIEQVEGMDHE